MIMQAAIKLQIEVSEDRVVKLPDDFPVGQAEMIILVPATKETTTTAPQISPAHLEALAYFMRPRDSSAEADSTPWLREDRER